MYWVYTYISWINLYLYLHFSLSPPCTPHHQRAHQLPLPSSHSLEQVCSITLFTHWLYIYMHLLHARSLRSITSVPYDHVCQAFILIAILCMTSLPWFLDLLCFWIFALHIFLSYLCSWIISVTTVYTSMTICLFLIKRWLLISVCFLLWCAPLTIYIYTSVKMGG